MRENLAYVPEFNPQEKFEKEGDSLKEFLSMILDGMPMQYSLRIKNIIQEVTMILQYQPERCSSDDISAQRRQFIGHSKEELLQMLDESDKFSVRENPGHYLALIEEIKTRR